MKERLKALIGMEWESVSADVGSAARLYYYAYA